MGRVMGIITFVYLEIVQDFANKKIKIWDFNLKSQLSSQGGWNEGKMQKVQLKQIIH